MPVFSVIAKEATNERLKALITQHYPNENHLEIATASWLVFESERVTPKVVFEKLVGTDDNSISMFISPVDAYYGIQKNTVWEWLGSKGL